MYLHPSIALLTAFAASITGAYARPSAISGVSHSDTDLRATERSSAATAKLGCKSIKAMSNGYVRPNNPNWVSQGARTYFGLRGVKKGGDEVLSATTSKYGLRIDFVECPSSYMGYKEDPDDEYGVGTLYGLVRVHGDSSKCLTANTSSTGKTTYFSVATCTAKDNSDLVDQYFALVDVGDGSYIKFLGGTRKKTKRDLGLNTEISIPESGYKGNQLADRTPLQISLTKAYGGRTTFYYY